MSDNQSDNAEAWGPIPEVFRVVEARAAIAQQPDATGRTPTDYALEFAEYMAKGAEKLLGALNDEDFTRDADDSSGDNQTVVALSQAMDARQEMASGLRRDIYEFRKRRDRAAIAQQPAPDCGHGWVYPRADGAKAKCGGPAICPMCKIDAAAKQGAAIAQPAEPEMETRADGKRVRVDRWEWGIRRIVALLWGNRQAFEIDEVVEAVRALVPQPAEDGDAEALVQVVAAQYGAAPPVKPPVRALRLVLEVGADSRRDMASALIHMAHRIEREELAGNGTWGGYSDGGNWELLTDPTMTHERFFAELTEYLRRSDKAHGITQEGE